MVRGMPTVLVILPNELEVTEMVGAAKFGWFIRLKH